MNTKDFVEKYTSKINPADEKAILSAKENTINRMQEFEGKISLAQSVVSKIKAELFDLIENGQDVSESLKAKRSEKESKLASLIAEKEAYRSLSYRLGKMYEQAVAMRETALILEILTSQNITTAEQLKRALNIN